MRPSKKLRIAVPVETELLTLLCRTPLTSDRKSRIDQLLEGAVDWERLIAGAAAWEVEPVAFHNLLEFGDALPGSVREVASNRERSGRAIALTRALVTRELVAALSDAGIHALAVKGAALAVMAYGDVSMRTYSDIDLLVASDDILRARATMVDLGYEPWYEQSKEAALIRDQHALELSNSRNKVELHLALLSRHLRVEIGIKELRASALRIEIAGRSISTLSRHHLLLFLCAHGTKHQWMNPRWICDVAQLAERLSAEEIHATIQLAERTHTKRILAFGLRATRDVLANEIPPAFLPHLVPESDTRGLLRSVVQRVFPGDRKVAHRPPLQRLSPNMTALIYWSLTRERIVDRVGSLAILLLRR